MSGARKESSGNKSFRRFSLVSTDGETRVVTQMQMIVWPDLGAPNEARLVCGKSLVTNRKFNELTNQQEIGGYGAESRTASGK